MIYIKASEEVSSIYGNGAYKRYRKTREKEQGTKWNNQMVLNTLWTIILVIIAIIIIVLTSLNEHIQTLNFVISELRMSS